MLSVLSQNGLQTFPSTLSVILSIISLFSLSSAKTVAHINSAAAMKKNVILAILLNTEDLLPTIIHFSNVAFSLQVLVVL